MGTKGIPSKHNCSSHMKLMTIGSDLFLIRLVKEAFEAADWRTHVDTGRYTFPVADNARHVADGLSVGGSRLETEAEKFLNEL
jgi:hypothetical protein